MKKRAAFLLFWLLSSLLIYAQAPVADFKADVTSGCAPIVVKFTDLSTGSPTAWEWDLGNGSTSTLQNPAATYLDPGSYSVTLKATNANGSATVTKTNFIVGYSKPNPAFNVSSRIGCTPATIQFTDATVPQEGNTITSWKWDFGDGVRSTEQNPSYIYKSPGSYTVTLSVTNDKGCSNLVTEPNYIDIQKGITTRWTNTVQTTCKPPVEIAFTNTTEGPGTLSYDWNFGNGETSAEKNPKTLYTMPGTYPVKLVVQSSLGCVDSLRLGSAVNITEIITKFNAPDVCPNTEVLFSDSSTAFTLSNKWIFSDGVTGIEPNIYRTFATPGTYTVKLVNNYPSCTDSLEKTFQVTTTPTIDFDANIPKSCALPSVVQFTNKTPDATTYSWDFGDGSAGSPEANPSHPYAAYGKYNVTLTATTAAGCIATKTKTEFVKLVKPQVFIGNKPERGCIPFPVTFRDSVITDDAVTSYLWNFGDGATSTEKRPTHVYTQQGAYTVTLTITTSGGCTETVTVEDAVKAGTKPEAKFSFTPNNVCASEAVQFTNETDVSDQWQWDFGDGTIGTEENPKHEFGDFGDLKVRLIAFNSGCADTAEIQTVTIKAPIAKFSFAPACENRKQITFTNQSVGNDGVPLTYLWNFGDGTTSTAQNPGPHTFAEFKNYTVSLTVSDGNCSFTATQNVLTRPRKPDFTVNVPNGTGCKPLTVEFIPDESNGANYSSYTWDFGDGTTGTSDGNTTHIYTEPGLYNVKITGTDANGCTDEGILKTGVIKVNGPVADFTSINNTGCKGITVNFDDASKTDGQNAIVNWRWDFGDRTSQSFDAPGAFQHTYTEVARYAVKLTVTDAAGCKDSVSKSNFVKTSAFNFDFSGTRQTCPGAPVRDTSIANIRNYKSLWSFGNGDTSNVTAPRYRYADTGTYNLKLVITDELGCKDSLTKENYVRVYRPHADFSANNFTTYCTPFEAQFTNNSTYYTSSNWNLGIGTSTQTNPVSYYTKTGTYNIKLTVTSPGGCKDDTTQVLSVYDPKEGKLTYEPIDFSCRPLLVNFKAFADMKGTFTWDFGDGNVIEIDSNTTSHIYDNVGNFIPKIILREPTGCVVPITGSTPVKVAGANIKFGIDKRFFCDSGLVSIFDSTIVNGSNVTYNWDFGDGHYSTEAKPASHYYETPGTYNLKLTVKTGSVGCVDSLSIDPDVRVSMTPVIHISGDSVICVNGFLPSSGVLDKTDGTFTKWAWQFPNGNTSALQAPPDQQFRDSGRFVISTIATNVDGCADTAVKNVLVHPLPTSDLPSTLTLAAGTPLQIEGKFSDNVVSYLWKPATGLSCTDCPNPVASPKFNTKYVVQYIDANGCRNTDLVQVIVLCENANVFIPNTFSPNGDGANDIFYVRGKGLDRVKSLRIYNRWGEVVFEKKDFPVNQSSAGWDGRYKGATPKADVYVYQVEVFCENGDVIRFDGNVALIQ